MAQNGGAEEGALPTNASPFDFDVDFDKVQRRRNKYLAEKAAERGETLLSGMDASDGPGEDASSAAASSVDAGPRGVGFAQGLNWLRGQAQDMANRPGMPGGPFPGQEGYQAPEEILYGGKRVTRWPYDDYHTVQQQYYVKLEELEHGLPGGETKDESSRRTRSLFFLNNRQASQPATPSATANTTNLQRPPDPPDIPTAVRSLALNDFEAKAEDRAIAIVSTWLFDNGLIDELLVHGGMKSSVTKDASSRVSDNSSVPSQEGIEIGPSAGFPIEGPSKMDKEMEKLKLTSRRTLTLINARLNDGVAASGAEVQELVNAVNSTKDDLGRLRELSTYISASGDNGMAGPAVDERSKFMLTRYPKLKKAINARRNLQRCFRELEFYSEIPVTCDKLREELHSAEWTENEWSSLRDVSREHVELEIFLVEAESGMKTRIDEEMKELQSAEPRSRDEKKSLRSSYMSARNGMPHNHEEVDNFLAEHTKNVWELGDEIRLRIMSGIGASFDLAMNNPAGMVALVEAVEVYETASEEYKTVHGIEAGEKTKMRFTDMRASALKQIYQDFELKCLEVFREIDEDFQDEYYEDEEAKNEAKNARLSAILRACNHLTSQIGFVQNQMSPCFPSHWALEMLWSTCVAHTASSEILKQIGGTEGQKLPDFQASSLLDLVAWVENFRETIEESFPNIWDHEAKTTYEDRKPELLQEGSNQVNMDVAKDSLAWANKMLWTVHDLAKVEFLFHTKEQTNEWLDNVYSAEHEGHKTSEGRLITSLCEDVYSLAGVQLKTIRERLTRRSEALVQTTGIIFKNLYEKQIQSRNEFLVDFETCCAASNDFIRMSEKCEEIISELEAECNLSPESQNILDEQSAALLGLYSNDAVFAAQKVHIYIFEPIEDAVMEDIFTEKWLDEFTDNELAWTLVRTVEDFMGDLEEYLDELMVGKTLDALVVSTVNFYIKALLTKSQLHNKSSPYWSDPSRALDRMRGDVSIMREFYDSLADSYPSLGRHVESEFDVLNTIQELLSIAAGITNSEKQNFIFLLQKHIKNTSISKLVVGDIWHLVNPSQEKDIYEFVDSMENEMEQVAPNDEKPVDPTLARQIVPGLRLDKVVAQVCEETKRSRPGINQNAAEALLQRFR